LILTNMIAAQARKQQTFCNSLLKFRHCCWRARPRRSPGRRNCKVGCVCSKSKEGGKKKCFWRRATEQGGHGEDGKRFLKMVENNLIQHHWYGRVKLTSRGVLLTAQVESGTHSLTRVQTCFNF
jgi:hypothetical protein